MPILNKTMIFICLTSMSFLSFISKADEIISADQLVEQLQATPTRSLSGQSFGANEGRATMSAIQFEYNSATLTQGGMQQVDQLAQAMKQLGQETFHVIGHTDASGSNEYNLTLSQRRANAVYNYLIEKHGIDPARLNAVGKGESTLVNAQHPDAPENRRVEAINSKVLN